MRASGGIRHATDLRGDLGPRHRIRTALADLDWRSALSYTIAAMADAHDSQRANGESDRSLPRLISNAALVLDDLPDEGANQQDLDMFALSFDGYEVWGDERCGRMANGWRDRWLAEQQ